MRLSPVPWERSPGISRCEMSGCTRCLANISTCCSCCEDILVGGAEEEEEEPTGQQSDVKRMMVQFTTAQKLNVCIYCLRKNLRTGEKWPICYCKNWVQLVARETNSQPHPPPANKIPPPRFSAYYNTKSKYFIQSFYSEQKDEETTAKETHEVGDKQTQETSSSREGVQVVGDDENIHLKPLDHMISKVTVQPTY